MADLVLKLKTLDINRKLLTGRLDRICAYPYAPQKGLFVPGEEPQPRFPCAAPEEMGLSSAHLEGFFRALEMRGMRPHSAIVLRRGHVLAEGYWKPYCAEYPQAMYSLSKSVTGMAVGMAAAEGYFSLDDHPGDFFPVRSRSITSHFYKPVTLRHLLTMTSGVDFNEVGSFADDNWVEAFLDSERSFEPGSQFSYNSLNSYILAAVVRETTGQTLTQFLTPRLWQPLGLGVPEWEKCPMGTEKGGWGLSLTTRGMAALGTLMLQDGVWTRSGAPKRLLPEGWMREMTRSHTKTVKGDGGYGYGYHIWLCSPQGDYQCNGAFGQVLTVIPRHEMVVAVTAGTSCTFLSGSASDIIGEYFYPDVYYSDRPLPKNPAALYSLRGTLAGLQALELTPPLPAPSFSDRLRRSPRAKAAQSAPVPPGAARYDRATLHFSENRAGLLPFVQQCVHNNYAPGISSIRLQFDPQTCTLVFSGSKAVHTLPVGMDGAARYCDLDFAGEYYRVGTTGAWEQDADGHDVLSLRLSFVELPNIRLIRLVFTDESVTVSFRESPDIQDCMEILGALTRTHGGLERIFVDLAMKSPQIAEAFKRVMLPVLQSQPEPSDTENS